MDNISKPSVVFTTTFEISPTSKVNPIFYQRFEISPTSKVNPIFYQRINLSNYGLDSSTMTIKVGLGLILFQMDKILKNHCIETTDNHQLQKRINSMVKKIRDIPFQECKLDVIARKEAIKILKNKGTYNNKSPYDIDKAAKKVKDYLTNSPS